MPCQVPYRSAFHSQIKLIDPIDWALALDRAQRPESADTDIRA